MLILDGEGKQTKEVFREETKRYSWAELGATLDQVLYQELSKLTWAYSRGEIQAIEVKVTPAEGLWMHWKVLDKVRVAEVFEPALEEYLKHHPTKRLGWNEKYQMLELQKWCDQS